MKVRLLSFLTYPPIWIPAMKLALSLGITMRKLRSMISELRKEGHPIMSGDKGYKYAKNYDEIKTTIARIKAHALAELEIARAMENRTFKEQGTLI